jgi:peptidoglycan/xylan/chitin deacetylase (PgdA/CDA1 family)
MRVRAALAIATAAATVACGPAPISPTAAPAELAPSGTTPLPARAFVEVDGHIVRLSDAPTVLAALAAARVTATSGHYLSVVGRRPLRPDSNPAVIRVDGHPAAPTTPLHGGDVVTVTAGRNLPEPVTTSMVAIPPPNPSSLYVGGHAGRLRVVAGVYSGEVLRRAVLKPARIGHLIRPRAVALTFDDGPDSTWTPSVLVLLAHAHIHATFCLIGEQAARYPRLVKRIVRAGHALCDHTWDHDLALATRPHGQIDLDIARGYSAIVKTSHGTPPLFFRAPGGNWSSYTERQAVAQHMTPLKWTVDPRDWSRPGTATIIDTVIAELRPGGVILMHDGGGDRSQTVAALRILLHRLPTMGYRFVVPPGMASQ